jgi:hypothetical protein
MKLLDMFVQVWHAWMHCQQLQLVLGSLFRPLRPSNVSGFIADPKYCIHISSYLTFPYCRHIANSNAIVEIDPPDCIHIVAEVVHNVVVYVVIL